MTTSHHQHVKDKGILTLSEPINGSSSAEWNLDNHHQVINTMLIYNFTISSSGFSSFMVNKSERSNLNHKLFLMALLIFTGHITHKQRYHQFKGLSTSAIYAFYNHAKRRNPERGGFQIHHYFRPSPTQAAPAT